MHVKPGMCITVTLATSYRAIKLVTVDVAFYFHKVPPLYYFAHVDWWRLVQL